LDFRVCFQFAAQFEFFSVAFCVALFVSCWQTEQKTNEEDLMDTFKKFGKVLDVFIPRDRASMTSRGFAFVTFVDLRDAEQAVSDMDE
jgi:hypothetical protein